MNMYKLTPVPHIISILVIHTLWGLHNIHLTLGLHPLYVLQRPHQLHQITFQKPTHPISPEASKFQHQQVFSCYITSDTSSRVSTYAHTLDNITPIR